jgi:lipoprotein-anchoring transpeptidase ErfK/SrfK
VQQRLIWLGAPIRLTAVMDRATLAAVARFRAKFGAGSGTTVTTPVWKVLTSVSRAHGVLPTACRTGGTVLCVDKTQKSVRLVVKGKVVLTTDARFGSEALPTREGVFRVQRKDRTHVSSLFHTSMPYAMFFSGGQAVHYSPYFHRDGYSGHSHGCVNIRDISVAAMLFARSPIGTRVVVYRS